MPVWVLRPRAAKAALGWTVHEQYLGKPDASCLSMVLAIAAKAKNKLKPLHARAAELIKKNPFGDVSGGIDALFCGGTSSAYSGVDCHCPSTSRPLHCG